MPDARESAAGSIASGIRSPAPLRDRAADATRYRLESLSDRAPTAASAARSTGAAIQLSRPRRGAGGAEPLRVLAAATAPIDPPSATPCSSAARPTSRRGERIVRAIHRGASSARVEEVRDDSRAPDDPEIPFESGPRKPGADRRRPPRRGELDLAASLASYEKGVALLARCQALLDGVDRSVALLTGVEEDGTPITSPFDAAATTDATSAAPRPNGPPLP